MKKPTLLIAVICATLTLGGCSGCSSIQKLWTASHYTVDAPTAQAIINDANKTIQVGDEAAASFLQLEQEHRASILRFTNEPRKYAHYLREPISDPIQIIPGEPPTVSVPRWTGILKAARGAVKTFSKNRTDTGKADLDTAIATVKTMITECGKMTTKATAGNP